MYCKKFIRYKAKQPLCHAYHPLKIRLHHMMEPLTLLKSAICFRLRVPISGETFEIGHLIYTLHTDEQRKI